MNANSYVGNKVDLYSRTRQRDLLKPPLKCIIWTYFRRTSIKVTRNLKKVGITRWLSLHSSVNGMFDEWIGVLEALNPQVKEKGSGGAVAIDSTIKMKILKFLECSVN